MAPPRTHYDAGELYGEPLRGALACSGNWRFNHRLDNRTELPSLTIDPKKVTCKICRLKIDNHNGGKK